MTCAKVRVVATIITAQGHRFVGENVASNPQATCPRGDMPSGEGYELCKSICAQPAHAEVAALALAGSFARGATLYLEGHTAACDACRRACDASGIAQIIVGAPQGMAS